MTTLHAPQPEPAPTSNRLRPVHEIRIGRIKAAIWENLTEPDVVRHNVTVQRLYRDPRDKNQWRSSDSFGRDDLPLVERVLHLAFEWIFEHPRK
ncbi:MAG: hypothetical protein AAF710_00550 [Planctomycetota bacterium]